MATFIFHCICILAFCGIINCLDNFKYRTLSRKIDTVRNALKKYSSLESDVASMKFELMDLKVELQDEKALTLKLLKQLNTSQAKVQLLTKDDLPGAEDVHQTADNAKSDFTASYSDEMKLLSKEMKKLKETNEETMNITYMFIKEQKILIREIQLNINDTSNNLTELETLTHRMEGKLQKLQRLTSQQQTNDKVINQSTKIITNAFLDEKEKRKELEKRMLYIINETNENMSKLEKRTDNTTTEIKHQLIILEGAIKSQDEKDERKELEKRMLYIINETNENMSKLEKRTENTTTEIKHQLIILEGAIGSQNEKDERKELEKRMLYIINETNENMSKLEKRTNNATTETNHQLIILKDAIESQDCNGFFQTNAIYTAPAYQNNRYCIIIVSNTQLPDHKIQVEFNTFELEESLDCRFDYLKLLAGEKEGSPAIGSRHCGKSLEGKVIVTNGSSLRLEFKTDASLALHGFQANISFVQKGCPLPVVPNGDLGRRLNVEHGTGPIVLPITEDDVEHDTEIIVWCHHGYSMYSDGNIFENSTVTIMCRSGNWIKSIPECKPKTCPAPDTNGTVEPRKPIYYHGNTVTIRCPVGFRVLDGSILTCRDERWSHSGMCVVRKTCPAPDTNGTVVHGKPIYYHNNTVRILCQVGFKVLDGSLLTCKDERWSHSGMCVPDKIVRRRMRCHNGRCQCKPEYILKDGICESPNGLPCRRSDDCGTGLSAWKRPRYRSWRCRGGRCSKMTKDRQLTRVEYDYTQIYKFPPEQ